jgi:NADPH2:quinone reductase
MTIPTTALQLQSTVKADGTLTIALVDVPVPKPKDGEVLVRIEATPINPSDQGLLFGAADLATIAVGGSRERPVVTARVPDAAMASMKARLDEAMPVGNEGAGTVVAAGSSPDALALVGKRVAVIGGAMYAQYRAVPVASTLVLSDDATAADGASSYINPLTALGFVETMRREGHTALVHTAAASNLGQMLQRICNEDGIALVNIVRKPEQRRILEGLGAKFIVDSSTPSFMSDLTDALAATGATLGFDATGGGRLASQILTCMEAALNRNATEYSRYGSPVHKQVYLYGGLDTRPTEIVRNFGMSWGIGGWLVFPFLAKGAPDTLVRLKARVGATLKTTFASHYAARVSLADALSADAIARYGQRATGEKYLIEPHR